jgi:hypothetical protein
MKIVLGILVSLGMLLSAPASFAQDPSPASTVGTMATGAPTSAPGPTYGPWTSPNPGQSASQCQPGEYAIGVQVIGAASSVRYCVGCVSQLRVVCQHLP